MSDKLYNLLPAVYRQRDAEIGEPLRGLMAILEEQYEALEADMAQLYDNWFIETCEEWVVPYIADLLGLKGIEPSPEGECSQRSFVANTLAYRRRKGTAPVIEQIGTDLTGHPAKVTEYFQTLATHQNLNHLQLHRPGTALVRPAALACRAHGPFDPLPHGAEVRSISSGRGRYNIPNIGLDLWRIQSRWIEEAEPTDLGGGRYLFDPLGRERPLFNRPRNDTGLESSPLPSEVPDLLDWRPLRQELERLREGVAQDVGDVYFGRQPVFEITVGGASLAAEEFYIASLDPWRKPSRGVAVDVGRGRIAFASPPAAKVLVSYADGFPGDLGAGPYDRRRYQVPEIRRELTLFVGGDGAHPDLTSALAAWDPDADPSARILLRDNRSFSGDVVVKQSKGSLRIEAQNGTRPVLNGSLRLAATGGLTSLWIEGVLINGVLAVNSNLQQLQLLCCTFVKSGVPSLRVDPNNRGLTVVASRCIFGAVQLPRDMGPARFEDCVIDGRNDDFAIASGKAAFACATGVVRSTVLGSCWLKQGELSESLFTDVVHCERIQTGCCRYSWIPFESRVPQRFRCQPSDRYEDLRIMRTREIGRPLTNAEVNTLREQARRESLPRFVSLDPLSPAYALLSTQCPEAVVEGAEDRGEMGAWHCLQEARRLRHLHSGLQDYVRFGMEAGVFRTTPRGTP